MNVAAIPHQAFPSMGYVISASKSGSVSLPVDPGMLIYSHFRHVSGTPAPEGIQGVNISKLRILDTLIEQLSRLKNQSAAEFGSMDGSEEQRINILIEQYQKQIKAAQAVNYSPIAPVTGMLFNIEA